MEHHGEIIEGPLTAKGVQVAIISNQRAESTPERKIILLAGVKIALLASSVLWTKFENGGLDFPQHLSVEARLNFITIWLLLLLDGEWQGSWGPLAFFLLLLLINKSCRYMAS